MKYTFDIYFIQIVLNLTDIYLFTLFIFILFTFFIFKLADVTVYFIQMIDTGYYFRTYHVLCQSLNPS